MEVEMNSALLAILFIFSLCNQVYGAERITLQSGNGNELGTATNPVYVSGGGSGAPTDADYLVGTANGSLSAEIVVGATPGGELGGTWGSPSIDDSLTVADWTLTAPVISGTPNAASEVGYDTTQKITTVYGGATASVATVHSTLSAGVGTQTLTNSTASDQDFTSPYTFPANSIYTGKVYRVTFFVEAISGTSSVTTTYYMKLGSTKVFTSQANNVTDGVTQSMAYSYIIIGRAAAGASAAVTTTPVGSILDGSQTNRVNQPVSLATNGTLTVSFGVTYSGTGSTETTEQQGYMIEELN